jgi:RNA polymerase sigma-70 factor (ECF subfamily)
MLLAFRCLIVLNTERAKNATGPGKTNTTMAVQSRGEAQTYSAFDALYRHYGREVWSLVFARWLNAEIANDICQETFLRLWQQWQRGEEIRNPRAWLLRVARNLAEDYGKSAFHRNGTQEPEYLATVSGSQPTPPEQLQKREALQLVRRFLQELAPTDREILTLRYALEYSIEEIAETLGINVSAVHMRLTRARQRLAARLANTGEFFA